MQIYKPKDQLLGQASEPSVKSNDVAGYRLSKKELDKLSGREDKQEVEQAASADLPDHIAKMVEQLKKLKEQLELQKEQLLKLKTLDNQQDEAVKAQVKAQANLVASLQNQVLTLLKTISDAMKDAEISNPGALLSALA